MLYLRREEAGGDLDLQAVGPGGRYNSLNSRIIGLGLIAVASLAGGLVGNLQQRAMNKENLTPAQVLLSFCSFALCYTILTMAVTGSLNQLASLFSTNADAETHFLLFLWASTSIMNAELVVTVVNRHSAVAAVLVTTLRKAISLVTSFFAYTKPFNVFHAVGAGIVLGSVIAHRTCKTEIPECINTENDPESIALEEYKVCRNESKIEDSSLCLQRNAADVNARRQESAAALWDDEDENDDMEDLKLVGKVVFDESVAQ